MKRTVVLLLISLMLEFPVTARTKVDKTEETRMIQSIEKTAQFIKTLQCSFRQEKNLSLLNDKFLSYGVMYFCQPSQLRWQYTSPYTYTFIINGSQVMLKNENRKTTIDANQSKIFQNITSIIVSSVTGKSLSSKTDFTVVMYKDKEEWIAALTPLKKEMKSVFKEIELHISPTKKMVTQVVLKEKTGDSTKIILSDCKTNIKIDEKVFATH